MSTGLKQLIFTPQEISAVEWTKPDFEEISLAGEVTAYVNTDDRIGDDTLRPQAVAAN